MKVAFLALLTAITLTTITLISHNNADIASKNLSKDADNFEINCRAT